MSMMVVPTWTVTGLLKTERAKASDSLLKKFEILNPVFSPNNDGVKESATINLGFASTVKVDLNIEKADGTVVKDLYQSNSVTTPDSKTWDGKDNDGLLVENGSYVVDLTYQDTTVGSTQIVDKSKLLTVDTVKPEVKSFFDKSLILNEDVIDNTIDFSVVYSEPMDQTVSPTMTFSGSEELKNILKASASSKWVNPVTYEFVYTVAGPLTDVAPSTATVSGAKDLAGNVQTDKTSEGTLSVSAPVLTASIVSPLAGDYVNGSQVIAVSSDNTVNASGAVKLSLDKSDWKDLSETENTLSSVPGFNDLPDGPFTLWVSVEDATIPASSVLLSVDLIKDATLPAVSNILVAQNGSKVTLTWEGNDVVSGVKGYNVYSSTDNFTTKNCLNSDLITDGTFSALNLPTGTYKFEVEAFDNAGNSYVSDPTSDLAVTYLKPVAPVAKVTSVTSSDGTRNIHVEWNGVGGYVDKYEIYVNGVTSTDNSVVADNTQGDNGDNGYLYKKDIKVTSDGSYNVLVKVWKGQDSISSEISSVDFASVATVTSTPVSQPVSVAAPKASAAVTTPNSDQSTPASTDDDGKIKGDESSSDSDTNKVNWTPWIVLFVLIILAGAATGGYFYWFNGEEEVATAVIRSPKTIAKVDKIVKETAKPKKTNKKSKRW